MDRDCCAANDVAMGHVWTAPAVQEESDFLRSVRVQPCIRPCMGLLLSSGFRAAIFLSCFFDRFLCSTWGPVSSPRPAALQSRRAQELSRLAVAPAFPGAQIGSASCRER